MSLVSSSTLSLSPDHLSNVGCELPVHQSACLNPESVSQDKILDLHAVRRDSIQHQNQHIHSHPSDRRASNMSSSTESGSLPASQPRDLIVSKLIPAGSPSPPASYKSRTPSPLALQPSRPLNIQASVSDAKDSRVESECLSSVKSPSPLSQSSTFSPKLNRSLTNPPLTAGILPSMTTLYKQRLDTQSTNSTRSRAMDNLTEALQRRLSQETSQTRPKLVLAGGMINPRRDERKALGLRAAVGSYKKRASQSDKSGSDSSSSSPSNSPPHQQLHHTIGKPAGSASDFVLPPKSAPPPIRHSSETYSPAASSVNYSQYLAARRESIMRRGGTHRRVVSETFLPGLSDLRSMVSPLTPQSKLSAATTTAALPSLEQIRNWAAHRKSNSGSTRTKKLDDSGTNSHSSGSSSRSSSEVKVQEYLHQSSGTARLKKRKSLRIYSHARDPSIPQICLSPDSDDDTDVESDPEPESACSSQSLGVVEDINVPTIQSGLRSGDALIEALVNTRHGSPDTRSSLPAKQADNSPNSARAEQRQFLLKNLAQAQQRRSGRIHGPTVVVAPV